MEVDGSILEGGGQILRVAVALCATLGRPMHITRIRANRKPKPGLRPQHLAGIKLVASMCRASLEGGAVGSTEVRVSNVGGVSCGSYAADPGTAGSIALLLQAAVPPACFAARASVQQAPAEREAAAAAAAVEEGAVVSGGDRDSEGGGARCADVVEIEMKGGTNADMAPQIDYVVRVFAPIVARMGVRLDVDVVRRGCVAHELILSSFFSLAAAVECAHSENTLLALKHHLAILSKQQVLTHALQTLLVAHHVLCRSLARVFQILSSRRWPRARASHSS
jgi:RNA 3'-terminal phosphate cyclase (ATP)